MRTHLDRLVTEKTLAHINSFTNSDFNPTDDDKAGIKNVCAKVSFQLSDDIEKICSFLGVSKRVFIEAAFIDAVDTAREIMSREGLFEAYQENCEQ